MIKRTAILFTLFIIAVIVLADLDRLPKSLRLIYDFPNGDKLGHFILYGLLNLFITLAAIGSFPGRPPTRVALGMGALLAVLIGLEEFSQKYFAARTFDAVDLLASYLGLILGGWIALVWIKKRPS